MSLILDIIEVDSHSAGAGTPEYCEVVYSAEVADKPTVAQLADRMLRVETALGLIPKPSFREWLRQNWKQLAGAFVGIVALVVGNFAWWQPRQVQLKQHADKDLAQQIDNQIEAKFQQHHFDDLVSDLKTMKGRMEEISGYLKIIVETDVKRIAGLPIKDFDANLDKVKTVLSVAKDEQVSVPGKTVGSIKSKLREANHNRAGFWGAATALVNFESPPASSSLSDCLAMPPVISVSSVTPNP